ncbi:GYDIA family GHMP kinase [Allomuricauda sp. d1]|uniref:GYDIA family GHMP kinase n=1 Tax=Allomuricauda sp. d1 TaxID=3136725 RepID=UPI0031DF0BEC
MSHFYSNGKLLLSGEYLVLDGARALAVPTKFGQSLEVSTTDTGFIAWQSLDRQGQAWFTATYGLRGFEEIDTSNPEISKTLTDILVAAKALNPNFLKSSKGCSVKAKLSFPRNWGLGSSSTLINNIAQWAQVNAHQLLWNTMGGSGYDISCAQHDHPILYHLENGSPKVERVDFNPSFKNQLYFIHLNQKQDSRAAIANYRGQDFDKRSLVSSLSQISRQMLNTKNLKAFENTMEAHETILSKVLKIEPVQQRLFSDYFGQLKSLGGWGGDFVLATGNEKTPGYFKSKGFEIVLPFSEMVL